MDTQESTAPERTIHLETRAGDPFHAAGAKLIAAIFASDECAECGISLDTLAGEGVPHGAGWKCAECAALPSSWYGNRAAEGR